ncbi:hypothetical protein EVAR_72083_1 [Eumeta japonica]|uniref:Uncharacterized protein n=1 Tax=Eumeta variegata TaxID=151549 RepID=A0A4C1SFH6_EUMVA|nr:hypothetical protein EVAR_72083_1 [Eumeta japonica]
MFIISNSCDEKKQKCFSISHHIDTLLRSFGLAPFCPRAFQRPGIPNKWLEADKSYKLTSPHTTMLQPNRHLNHGWQSFSLGITLGYQPHDSVRHYQTEALLGLYTPIAERQGVALTKTKPAPGGVTGGQSDRN